MTTTRARRTVRHTFAIVFAMLLALVAGTSASAYSNAALFSGQGLLPDDFGSYDLTTELCGVENGADAAGPYLLWVLTANKKDIKNADITGPWGTQSMQQVGNGGTFKFVSEWYDPGTLTGTVTATYDGKPTNAQLVISHGCRPFKTGAWCAPWFWYGAKAGAWTLTGHTREALFNDTVYDYFYGATFVDDPTLGTVLTNGTVLGDQTIFGGKPLAGTSGYPLNAVHATAAYLTNQIPGYKFDWNVKIAGGSNACPIDHYGNFKPLPQ